MPTPTQIPIQRVNDFLTDPLDRAGINTDFDLVINALNAVIGNLSDVRRSDGQVRSFAVDVAVNAAEASAQVALTSEQNIALMEATVQTLHDVVVAKEALINPHYAAIDDVHLNMSAVLGAAQAALDAATQVGIATTKANATAIDAAQTAADRIQTGLDVVATNTALATVNNPLPASDKGAPNGVAPLVAGKVPAANLPPYPVVPPQAPPTIDIFRLSGSFASIDTTKPVTPTRSNGVQHNVSSVGTSLKFLKVGRYLVTGYVEVWLKKSVAGTVPNNNEWLYLLGSGTAMTLVSSTVSTPYGYDNITGNHVVIPVMAWINVSAVNINTLMTLSLQRSGAVTTPVTGTATFGGLLSIQEVLS